MWDLELSNSQEGSYVFALNALLKQLKLLCRFLRAGKSCVHCIENSTCIYKTTYFKFVLQNMYNEYLMKNSMYACPHNNLCLCIPRTCYQ